MDWNTVTDAFEGLGNAASGLFDKYIDFENSRTEAKQNKRLRQLQLDAMGKGVISPFGDDLSTSGYSNNPSWSNPSAGMSPVVMALIAGAGILLFTSKG